MTKKKADEVLTTITNATYKLHSLAEGLRAMGNSHENGCEIFTGLALMLSGINEELEETLEPIGDCIK